MRSRWSGVGWLALSLTAVLSGCAGTDVNHFADGDAKEPDDQGVRYYKEAPFILVYSDRGNYSSELIYLPDTSTIHSADPWECLASNELTLQLENGVLVSANGKVDATRIPKALLETVKDVAMAAAKTFGGAANQGDTPTKPMVYLFKLVHKASGLKLQAAAPVEISVVAQ